MKDAGVEAIKKLGEQLKRLHHLLDMPNVEEHIGTEGVKKTLKEVGELDSCLMQIAKRHNGLEY